MRSTAQLKMVVPLCQGGSKDRTERMVWLVLEFLMLPTSLREQQSLWGLKKNLLLSPYLREEGSRSGTETMPAGGKDETRASFSQVP